MRKYILAPLLAIACGTTHAAPAVNGAPTAGKEWRQVVSGANSTGYADAGSIRRSGAIASMRVLVDYSKPPFDGNNLPYRSLTMQNEYQCEDKRFRVLAITSHAGNMGGGARPYSTDEAGDWEAVSPQSIQQQMWELACAPNAARQ